MKKDVMLTTIDNPYNPFTNFDEWWAFDISHGYNTCAYLSRIVDVFSENINAFPKNPSGEFSRRPAMTEGVLIF